MVGNKLENMFPAILTEIRDKFSLEITKNYETEKNIDDKIHAKK